MDFIHKISITLQALCPLLETPILTSRFQAMTLELSELFCWINNILKHVLIPYFLMIKYLKGWTRWPLAPFYYFKQGNPYNEVFDAAADWVEWALKMPVLIPYWPIISTIPLETVENVSALWGLIRPKKVGHGRFYHSL